MGRKILKALGYGVFFLIAVLAFMVWTFPMDKATHWVERQAQRKMKLDVTIGELSLAGIGGIEASDILLRFKPKKDEVEAKKPGAKGALGAGPKGANPKDKGAPEGADGAEGAEGVEGAEPAKKAKKARHRLVRVDKLEADISLWTLLFGKSVDLTGQVELMGGRIEGLHVTSGEGFKNWQVAAEKLDKLDLAGLPILEDWIGTRLKGKLSGSLEMTLGKGFSRSKGKGEFQIEGVTLPAPELEHKTYGKFELTDIALGMVAVKLTLDDRGSIPALADTVKGKRAKKKKKETVLHFAELQMTGGDIEAGLDERSTIAMTPGKKFSEAYMNIHGFFAPDPGFFEREVRKGKDREKPNLFLRTLLSGDRKWKRAERDGAYGFRCIGRPRLKSCNPTAPPGRGRYTPEARKKRGEAKKDSGDRSKPGKRGSAGADKRWQSKKRGAKTSDRGGRPAVSTSPRKDPRLHSDENDRLRPSRSARPTPAAPIKFAHDEPEEDEVVEEVEEEPEVEEADEDESEEEESEEGDEEESEEGDEEESEEGDEEESEEE